MIRSEKDRSEYFLCSLVRFIRLFYNIKSERIQLCAQPWCKMTGQGSMIRNFDDFLPGSWTAVASAWAARTPREFSYRSPTIGPIRMPLTRLWSGIAATRRWNPGSGGCVCWRSARTLPKSFQSISLLYCNAPYCSAISRIWRWSDKLYSQRDVDQLIPFGNNRNGTLVRYRIQRNKRRGWWKTVNCISWGCLIWRNSREKFQNGRDDLGALVRLLIKAICSHMVLRIKETDA